LAFIYSYPEWVITELSQAYQVEGDELIALLVAGNTAPQVDLVARPGQFSIAELLGLPEVEPGRWSPLAARLKGGAPSDLPAVRTGAVGVQDEGSQLVALALSEVVPTCEDSTWLDMCAGPGGKAALLAGLAVAQNFDFIALEPSAARAQLVEKSLAGLNSSRTSVVNIDAREYQTQATVTRILVDAPCTGLGALRRRPEARWRRTSSDVPTLAALQTQLLDHAADLIAAGGVIAYSTCSPVLAETDAIVDAFLATHPNFNPISVEQILPTIPNIAQRMRLRPDVHGTDGMFVALLHRIS
jgi:16S rRNA (cytosine967-C5)-methyltransferase